MDWWRISKYDPAFRDENYVYQRDEWTSAADIGRTFDGETLDAEEYLATETAHIEAVRAFTVDASVKALTVTSFQGPSEQDFEYLEKLSVPDGHELARQMRHVREGDELSGHELEGALRLLIRKVFWCRLVHEERFIVDVLEYLYVCIGTVAPSERAIARTRELGLFVEETRDPST
jgi:hypothetical protein